METTKEPSKRRSRSIITLYILMGMAAAVGLVSAIGSTCVTFDLFTMGVDSWWDIPSFSIVRTTQPFFIFSYIVTWIVTILWGYLILALRQGKSNFYRLALITSIAGFISGFIPSFILFYEDYLSFGQSGMSFTPSWFRTIGNLIILLYLLMPQIKQGIKAFIEETSASTRTSFGSQVSQVSSVLFGFGLVIISQPLIMPLTHAVWSDVRFAYGLDFEILQFAVGILVLALAFVTLLAGRLINTIHSTKVRPSNA